jgi:acyl-CoA synthetase (NDP forming)
VQVRQLDAFASAETLRAAGVPVVPALRLAPGEPLPPGFTGFPAVLKAEGRNLAHRSERRAVVLGLRDRAAVEDARASMAACLDGDLEAFQVQAQVPAGPELLAGFTRDPAFGTVILLGRGGVEAEADPDVALRLWPCTRKELAEMLDELRGRRRFLGFRGQPAVDRAALVDVLWALGALADAHPAWQSVDLNPLIVRANGRLAAVDHLVIVGDPARVQPPLEPAAIRSARVAPFFRARSIAVVGASNTPGKAGYVILQNLARLGFEGSVFPVNPRQTDVLGKPCHPSLAAIGRPVDLAVAAIPREACLALLEDCHAAGIAHLIVSTAGFSDQGPEGRDLECRLVARCRALGIQLMGPNSIGTLEVETGLVTSLASVSPVPRGGAAFLGQTGLFASCFPRWLAATGRQGALRFASIGNKAGVDEADLLGFLAEDPATRCVGLYVEGVRDGRRLVGALAETSRRKPVVVLKSGRTALGRQAAASHTGALAADDRVADCALRQAGCVRVESFEELFDQARAFDVLPLPRGPRLGVVSITGVGCVLTADAAGRAAIELPTLSPTTITRIREVAPDWAPIGNPVDMWSTIERVGAAEAYRALCEAVVQDEGVDALLIIHITIPESTLDPAVAFGRLKELAPEKPVLGAMFGDEPLAQPIRRGMEALGIPVFADPARAVCALAGMVRYAGWRGEGSGR